jgi:hypothetical protein
MNKSFATETQRDREKIIISAPCLRVSVVDVIHVLCIECRDDYDPLLMGHHSADDRLP